MGATYLIFDGDKDKWGYGFLKGWAKNENIDFEFSDAHDLDSMTGRAQDEYYVKQKLRERMQKSDAVLVIVGEKTKNLYKFVRWELDLALELGLPIVVANLNDKREIDREFCPPVIRDACAVRIPFRRAAIKPALDNWPRSFRALNAAEKGKGPRHYTAETYRSWGL